MQQKVVVIEQPPADMHTRAGAEQVVTAHYHADDLGRAESEPAVVTPRAGS